MPTSLRPWARATTVAWPALAILLAACPHASPHFTHDGGAAGDGTVSMGTDAGSNGQGDGAQPDAQIGTDANGGPDATMESNLRERSCSTVVRYQDQPGKNVFIAGTFNAFSPTATRLNDGQGTGTYTATLTIDAGLYPYKLVVDGNWILDPSHRYRAYDSNVENSGLRVPNCHEPLLELAGKQMSVNGASRGGAQFRLRYTEANQGPGPDTSRFVLLLRSGTSSRALSQSEWSWDASTWQLTVNLSGLTDGKYTLNLTATNKNGTASNRVLLPFWVEADAFDWHDAIIYMAMIDRFRDGDPSNNPAPVTNAVRSADYYGGDLNGITASIRDGYFDQMGIKALWLTPFNTQPVGAFPDSDGVHYVTGYHGYWPAEAREVDPRIGGDAALMELTNVAHQHGIRVLMDWVINHVHENHSYITQHPDWFNTQADGLCICGTANCDWTTHRLTCIFAPYLPNIRWTNNTAAEQFVADAVFWLEHFDLDGFRIDAVKHVPDIAIFNTATAIRENFEAAGTKYYTVGETAMGWYDCNPMDATCNADNYGTISRYIGYDALSGQFDFVLHHSTVLNVFAFDSKGMIHANVWTQASETHYPMGAQMATYVASHDETRFVTEVSTPNLAGNKWPDQQLPTQPTDPLPYKRLALAETWNMTIPYIPMLYYGDEYGEFGAADPDNRHMMRFDSNRNATEQALFQTIKAIGTARLALPALRRGTFTTLDQPTETFWAYARQIPGTMDFAIVALNRDAAPITKTVALGPDLPIMQGMMLNDRLGGATAMMTPSGLQITLPAYSSAIYSP
jgi:glycosidase